MALPRMACGLPRTAGYQSRHELHTCRPTAVAGIAAAAAAGACMPPAKCCTQLQRFLDVPRRDAALAERLVSAQMLCAVVYCEVGGLLESGCALCSRCGSENVWRHLRKGKVLCVSPSAGICTNCYRGSEVARITRTKAKAGVSYVRPVGEFVLRIQPSGKLIHLSHAADTNLRRRHFFWSMWIFFQLPMQMRLRFPTKRHSQQ